VFGHTVEALCDLNLSTIIADYPRLLEHFSKIQKGYFPDQPGSAAVNQAAVCNGGVTTNKENPFSQRLQEAVVSAESAATIRSSIPHAKLRSAQAQKGQEGQEGEGGQTWMDKKRSAKQQRFKDRSRNSVLFAGAAVVLYMLYGNVLQFGEEDDE
jgi:hypothetical protein